VVDDGHLVAALEKGVDEVRSDEAGAACHESAHEAGHASRGGLEPPEPVVPSLAVGGLFVTFEGIDRSGKTTQARMLSDALGDRALPVREPGGTAVGERVRELLKDPAVEIGPQTEALLFAAARAELVEKVIRPALASGLVVVSDRL